jgi:RNA polymerase sigma-70 factor (ECF subfamily)
VGSTGRIAAGTLSARSGTERSGLRSQPEALRLGARGGSGSGVTDDELMIRGAQGDEDAFRILVQRWERPVLAFLERMLSSREEAEDLGQETFLRVCRQAPRYRPTGQFRSWLFRIAGNLARSRLRRRRILKWVRFEPGRHEAAADEEPVDRKLEREESRRVVRAALARLPDRQRQAVVLRRYDGLSHREIASALGTTIPAVESLLHRALVALKQDLARTEVAKP